MVEPNERIDRNTEADIELLMYLPHADVVVSNDLRFLRRAFDTLWKPKGKSLFATEEFTDWISHI